MEKAKIEESFDKSFEGLLKKLEKASNGNGESAPYEVVILDALHRLQQVRDYSPLNAKV